LFDVNGKLLREATSYRNDFSINIADFKRGIYLLKLYNGYEMEVQIEKIIKQ
jgi:aldose sugar dehydrogenase